MVRLVWTEFQKLPRKRTEIATKGDFQEKDVAGVVVKANQKGWMDEEKMKEWLREVYVRRPGGFFHISPSLLVCDSMPA